MDLQQLANIAEIVGMLVIAITVIFLTLQMRQNTKALHSNASHNAHELISAMYETMFDGALANIFLRGMRDPATLSEVEIVQFTAYWQRNFFCFQNWYYQSKEGALDEQFWSSYSAILTDIYQTPGIRQFWERRGHYYSKEFRTYLDSDLFMRQPNADYRVLGTVPITSSPSTET